MGEPIVAAGGLLCLVMVVMIAAVTAAQRRRDHREHDRWRHWADRHGWTFTARPQVAWSRRVPGEVRFAVSGRPQGRWITVAECSVTDADTNTSFFVAAVAMLRRPLPDTEVEPRGTVSRLLGAGAQTGRPDFDRAFRIRTADPRWLPPALIEAQVAAAVPSSWTVRGTDLVVVRRGRFNPEQVPRIAAEVLPLAALLDPPRPAPDLH
ncbi:hypothetical protein [Actinoplanes aureus]|uniref:Uncharacterized protein n=1 Tax=Actinoplanes aureus TaxID=2792083 RepID=A0A931FZV0_9ACTN|nr:hypothetical protein [Actinoplanes aureus]MBG0560774.1 hypothetical protein [Actinoplanes aureus]